MYLVRKDMVMRKIIKRKMAKYSIYFDAIVKGWKIR